MFDLPLQDSMLIRLQCELRLMWLHVLGSKSQRALRQFSIGLSFKVSSFKMLSLISKSNQCVYKDSVFAFIVDFMLSHHETFEKLCYLCPFGFCYRKFMILFAVLRLVSQQIFAKKILLKISFAGFLVERTFWHLEDSIGRWRADVHHSLSRHCSVSLQFLFASSHFPHLIVPWLTHPSRNSRSEFSSNQQMSS